MLMCSLCILLVIVYDTKMSQRKLLTKSQALNNLRDVESLVDDLQVLMVYL